MASNTKLGAVTMALSDCYKVVAGVPGNGAQKINRTKSNQSKEAS